MEHVAFLRNVNQGQRGQPATAQLADAFDRAGAREAHPFQSNGTVLFTAQDPEALIDAVRSRLAVDSGFDTLILTRPLTFVGAVVDRHADAAAFARRELTLFDPALALSDVRQADAQALRRRCTIVEAGPGWAVIENDAARQSNGTPTIEAALGTPATSRGLPTLLRLVARYAR